MIKTDNVLMQTKIVQNPGFEILGSANELEKKKWLDIWLSWPEKDIFAHPEYLGIFETRDERAFAAVYSADRATILYPFLKRSFNSLSWISDGFRECFDIASPYGYGGAYYWGDPALKTAVSGFFWTAYNEWLRINQCISEFTRFHLFEQDLAVYPGEKVLRGKNVVRSLYLSKDEIWMDFEHKVRKNIKKSERSGLKCLLDEHGKYLEEFIKIYESTMHRRKARGFYFFDRSFFESISRRLPRNSIFFHVLDGNKIVSTELVLFSKNTAYSFLGGTLEDAFDKRPNELLKYTVISWAKDQGISNYVLGGGYNPEDGVYRYKLSFAPGGEYPFYTGQRIIDEDKFNDVISIRRHSSKKKWEPEKGYFPPYRS